MLFRSQLRYGPACKDDGKARKLSCGGQVCHGDRHWNPGGKSLLHRLHSKGKGYGHISKADGKPVPKARAITGSTGFVYMFRRATANPVTFSERCPEAISAGNSRQILVYQIPPKNSTSALRGNRNGADTRSAPPGVCLVSVYSGKTSRALPSSSCQRDASLWNPIFLRAERVGGSSLYRLPSSCHAESLIHAVRFFRKEKSFLPGAGRFLAPHRGSCAEHARDFLRRSPCPARRAAFFLYEKMGRRAIVLRGVSARQAPHPQKIYGNPRGFNPLEQSSRDLCPSYYTPSYS